MSASSVPAVKAKVIELLEAESTLSGVSVRWAPPTEASDYDAETVFFRDTEQREEWATSLGAQSREEDYHLDLAVRVYRAGDDPEATESAAWDLRHGVSLVLRTDPGLAGLLLQYIEISETRMAVSAAAPAGWVAEASCRLHCVTRI